LHISKNIVPASLAAGATQAQVDEMLIENPRRFFAPAGYAAVA
jgi:predicted metal-dependent phosphotriesterase family hydrolase